MKTIMLKIYVICMLLLIPCAVGAQQTGSEELLVLCYHSVLPTVGAGDRYSVSQRNFIDQMAYLTRHGYHPVSVQTVLDAVNGGKPLPSKAVLLTFDDGYRSYYDFVFPLLKRFNYPSVLSVVGAWVEEKPPRNLIEPLMDWSQIRQAAQSGLVEIASHTYDLHQSVIYTPQGNVGAMVGVRAYDPVTRRYESDDAFESKIRTDLLRQNALLEEKIGKTPKVLAWPYGKFNQTSLSVAKNIGFEVCLTLESGLANLTRPHRINRVMVSNLPIVDFIELIKKKGIIREPIRAAQVDLDLICDPGSGDQTDKNLGRLIDRLSELKINTVFVQAFSDTDGSGNIKSVYFNNRVLPVRADILGHVTHQLIIRDIQVYAWMPTLSFVFPDRDFNKRFRVRQFKEGTVAPSRSWYQRLTPFSDDVAGRVRILYEDLARSAQINGILMQDDAYLNDFEDHHPLALDRFSRSLGKPVTSAQIVAVPALMEQWTAFKSRSLMTYTRTIAQGVRKFRPDAAISRNLYANVILNPRSELWFAQNYGEFLKAYDYVVVMAYPQMEKIASPLPWLRNFVVKANFAPRAKDKVIYKIQTYDWTAKSWIKGPLLVQELREILAAGGRHLAYYPDNLWKNAPALEDLKSEMSTRTQLAPKEINHD